MKECSDAVKYLQIVLCW